MVGVDVLLGMVLGGEEVEELGGVVVSGESSSSAVLVGFGTLVGCSLAYSRAEFTRTFNALSSPQSGGDILPTSIRLLMKS